MTNDPQALPMPATVSNEELPVLTSPLLASQPGIVHGITRRWPDLGGAHGNVSYSAPRDREDAWRMRQRWCGAIGVDPDRLVTTGQVHGNGVLRVHAAQAGAGARPESPRAGVADALITNQPGVVLLSMHADCLPILLFDPITPAVGVVHAGWRGTVANVAGAAIAALTESYGTDPATVLAYLGPAIAGPCYEVGAEVSQEWAGLVGAEHAGHGLHPSGSRWTFDLAAANTWLLEQAGVPSERIEQSGICTRCGGDDWFSHRGQGPATGRFGAIIALNDA